MSGVEKKQTLQSIPEVKAFWDQRALGEIQDNQVTHSDVWQRWLEIEKIKSFLKPTDRLLDVGCGNGYTSFRVAASVKQVLGIDYSEEMIARANRAQDHAKIPNLGFQSQDVLDLSPAKVGGTYDVAITERCLINLADWETQKNALTCIASVLNPGGRLIFVEGSESGRQKLNEMRVNAGLETMPKVWHNIDFEKSQLLDFMSEDFTVEAELNLGIYDFIARVVHPLLVAPEPPNYEARINQIAAELASKFEAFGDISRLAFFVFKKRG